MSKTNTRYFVFSKSSPTKSLKNAATREEARKFKRNQRNPSNFAIYDRDSYRVIR